MKFRLKRRRLSSSQIIMLGFMGVIALGTFLLMLPWARTETGGAPLLDALFTATSATCVTGLITNDTATYWSGFGQVVILCLIQIGGLGVITIAVFIVKLSGRKIGLMQRSTMQEAIAAPQMGGIVRMTGFILKMVALIELLGAAALLPAMIPEFGVGRGIWYAVFHSVSSFCNAGFDLMGRFEAYSSLSRYAQDYLVSMTAAGLILIGGLGFVVWKDISVNRLNFSRYSLHAKMVLTALIVLLVVPTALFLLLESDGVLKELDGSGKCLAAFFAAVTPRTAGFNTTDVAGLSDAGKLLTLILMLIGGNPGSTAGGVKTTTIMVLLLYIVSMIRHTDGVNVYGRRLEDKLIEKAAIVFTLTLSMAVLGSFIICAVDNLPLADVLLETFSAVDTVGMSTGITRDLSVVSKVVIILLMYCGRIGSLSFALTFTDKRRQSGLRQPMERINIG